MHLFWLQNEEKALQTHLFYCNPDCPKLKGSGGFWLDQHYRLKGFGWARHLSGSPTKEQDGGSWRQGRQNDRFKRWHWLRDLFYWDEEGRWRANGLRDLQEILPRIVPGTMEEYEQHLSVMPQWFRSAWDRPLGQVLGPGHLIPHPYSQLLSKGRHCIVLTVTP